MKKFQSLTGSIHTKFKLLYLCWKKLVSIPHRFNSHKQEARDIAQEILSFNPSQVQFTLVFNWDNLNAYQKFQSLTGSIHTRAITIGIIRKNKFQSLTGSIHTKEKED